jgi:hypothetical protein
MTDGSWAGIVQQCSCAARASSAVSITRSAKQAGLWSELRESRSIGTEIVSRRSSCSHDEYARKAASVSNVTLAARRPEVVAGTGGRRRPMNCGTAHRLHSHPLVLPSRLRFYSSHACFEWPPLIALYKRIHQPSDGVVTTALAWPPD